MGQGHLPGTGLRAAADEAGVRDGVVRGAEGADRNQGGVGGEQAGHGVDLRGLQGLVELALRRPAQGLDLVGGDRVAAVVAEAKLPAPKAAARG